MEEPNNIFILGDSYSTYEGYIPKDYRSYYGDNRKEEPIVKGVERTWWSLLAEEEKFNVVLSDSFSGSTICNTVREGYAIDSSFVSRIDKYIKNDFFEKNRIDTMFILGGTNDSWINAPIGEPMYSEWTFNDLKCVLPAFCYLLFKAKKVVKNIIVIINSDLKDEITNGFKDICEKFDVKYLSLKGIDKQSGHPTECGMKQISNQVIGFLHTR